MDREDIFKLLQCTSDDDTRAPDDIVKSVVSLATKGKPAALKELSEWLCSRLEAGNSPTVLVKVLRLVMMICSSKKGGKFKAQFSQDAAALLRACTVFESEPGPEHGDKPMMHVRKSAVKCLEMLDLAPQVEDATRSVDTSTAAEVESSSVDQPPTNVAATSAAEVESSSVDQHPTNVAATTAADGQDTVVQTRCDHTSGGIDPAVVSLIESAVQRHVDSELKKWKPTFLSPDDFEQRMNAFEKILENRPHAAALLQSDLGPGSVTEELLGGISKQLEQALAEAKAAIETDGAHALAAFSAIQLTHVETELRQAKLKAGAAEAETAKLAADYRVQHDSISELVLELCGRVNTTEECSLRLDHSMATLGEKLQGSIEQLSHEISSSAEIALSTADSVATSDLGAKLRQLERKVNASQQAEQQKFAQELDESKKELTKVHGQLSAMQEQMGKHAEEQNDTMIDVEAGLAELREEYEVSTPLTSDLWELQITQSPPLCGCLNTRCATRWR